MKTRNFVLALAALTVVFAAHLIELARFALKSETFSYIVLIPFIAAYLMSMRWKAAVEDPQPSSQAAAIAATIGFLLLAINWFGVKTTEIRLCVLTLSFVAFVLAAAFRFLGADAVRQLAFPLALLLFMVPLPPIVMNGLEVFFQHASAFAAAGMMNLSGLPSMQNGLYFQLPGFAIEVAQECSGIRSTLVLFITSLIAGYLLLRRPRDRAILAFAIVPLAILRNGFRIFSLAWLSVEVNPKIIDSALHHRGGPIFFALSLIPLFVLLLILKRMEKKHAYAS